MDSSGEFSSELLHLEDQEANPTPEEDLLMNETRYTDDMAQLPPSQTSIESEVNSLVSSLMSCAEIVTLLARHGCRDLTPLLSSETISKYPISTGGFGDIYRGKLLGNHPVAIKTVRVFESYETGKYHKLAARELYAWSKCRHPNVVELMGLVVFRGSLAMVSTWAEHGTLPVYLRKNPSTDRRSMSALICRGLAYLHGNSMVHGDLKGDNVLISSDGKPMLNDFGNASVQNASLQFSQTTTGVKYSTRWAAPEIMMETTLLTREADIYALGMTILETFTGDIPYADIKKDLAVMHNVVYKKELPSRPMDILTENSIAGNRIWDVLTSCWSHDPGGRPSAMDVQSAMESIEPYMFLPLPSLDDRQNRDPVNSPDKLSFSGLHGLIIGINTYKEPLIHIDLRGCVGDAKSMLAYLVELGVPPNQLLCLFDKQATREGILSAFRSHLINNPNIKRDDPIVIYFAGHGDRMAAPLDWQTVDWNVDMILPYDAGTRDVQGSYIHGIPDLTLAYLLDELNQEKGNNITIIFDACHSGGGTRGEVQSRRSHDLNSPPIPDTLDAQLRRSAETRRPVRLKQYITSKRVSGTFMASGLDTHILLAACDYEEQAQEIENKDPISGKIGDPPSSGVFTTILLAELRRCDLATTNYTTLLRNIRAAHRHNGQSRKLSGLLSQTFQCEGRNQDRLLFSVKHPTSYSQSRIPLIPTSEKSVYRVNVGSAQGIAPGTEFGVFSNKKDPTSSPIALLVARNVESTVSQLHSPGLDKCVEIFEDAYITIVDYSDNSNRVQIWVDEAIKQNEFWNNILIFLDWLPLSWATSPNTCDLQLTLAITKIELRGRFGPGEPATFHILEPGLEVERLVEVLTSIIYFYYHLKNQNKEAPVQDQLEMALWELQEEDANNRWSKFYVPKGDNLFGRGATDGTVVLYPDPHKLFGIALTNNSVENLWPYLLYFDFEDYSVSCLYEPPSRFIRAPLPAGRALTIGYGSRGATQPFQVTFTNQKSKREHGAFMLLVFSERADIGYILQESPFVAISHGSRVERRNQSTARIWDTVVVRIEMVEST